MEDNINGIKNRTVTLEMVGKTRFTVGFGKRSIVFMWIRDTSVSNIIWMRVIGAGLRWPPYIWFQCFAEINR